MTLPTTQNYVKNMNLLRYASLLLLSGLLTACTTPRSPAPISDRSAQGGKPVVTPAAAASTVSKPVIRDTDKRGFYTVKRGDTLIHIALEVGQNYRDIIAWNNLTNPNDIKVDQVLRVAPPEGSLAITAVQAAGVASNGAGEVRPLAAIPPNAMKTMPRGEKRPYSEANLAEMKKGEGNAAPVAAVPTPAAPQVPVKIAEPAADEDAVSWMWPTEGKLASGFDEAKKGIDIAGTSGQAVFAAASGKILYANSIRGYGNLVIVKHTNNLLSAYAHNKTILVKENQMVIKGQKIAEMGNTDTDAVKLHFEIRQQGKPIDPLKLLPGR
jgi:lipoprotein NlpD